MFNKQSKKSYSPKAGPAEIRVLAINYSKEEYKHITGRELPYDPNYNPIERNDKKVHKLTFLTHGPGGFVDLSFYCGNEDRPESQSGKTEWINDQGQSWWTDDPTGNTDYSWINTNSTRRRAKVGEVPLINFMISLYNPSNFGNDSDFKFLKTFDGKTGEDFSFDGDLKSYRDFLKICEKNTITCMYEVSVDEQQDPIKMYQKINSRNFWRSKSMEYAQSVIKKNIENNNQYFSSNLYLDTFCEVSAEQEDGKVHYKDLAGYNNAENGAAFIPVENKTNYELPF